ncbi:WD40 repeat-like protein [Tothia fuscella]|uniref:ASTRA-associated protein 1 n=1 Tax=Tothia fuscella TaxID=1048955 RepID=A0A9P4NJU7_9PEZI|nr:WD40 repeat-like protein [Tothia fuscella]
MAQPQIQSSTLPPAQPAYVLRGHAAQVHALHFFRKNSRLLSGDAEGWVIMWDIATKRAAAVWKAHDSAILGLGSWGDERIISHGRDNALKVWQIRRDDESTFSTGLPVGDSVTRRKEPWLLHSLPVNALNFCAFAMCSEQEMKVGNEKEMRDRNETQSGSILVAVPGLQEGFVNIIQLPSEERLHTVQVSNEEKGVMIMALQFFYKNEMLHLISGLESGKTSLQIFLNTKWKTLFRSATHSQPILSLGLMPDSSSYFTSGADSIIGMHVIESMSKAKTIQTKHSGQQSLTVRSDGKIFATAGWDSRIRVYSTNTMKELAVLKWHKEGCYSVAFADIAGMDVAESATTTDSSCGSDMILRTVKQRREDKARQTHWLAAGSKDGKVSLWDIY